MKLLNYWIGCSMVWKMKMTKHMPTINKQGKRRPIVLSRTDKLKTRKKIYNSKEWKKGLRLIQLRKQPFCEVCDQLGRITLGQCCHHIKTFVGVQTSEEMYETAFDENNLCTLCTKHHSMLHSLDEFKNRKEKRPEDLAEFIRQNPTIEKDFEWSEEIDDDEQL